MLLLQTRPSVYDGTGFHTIVSVWRILIIMTIITQTHPTHITYKTWLHDQHERTAWRNCAETDENALRRNPPTHASSNKHPPATRTETTSTTTPTASPSDASRCHFCGSFGQANCGVSLEIEQTKLKIRWEWEHDKEWFLLP